MNRLIYLASPYTGTPEVEQQRFEEAAKAFAWLTNSYKDDGTFFYSPIASCHPVKVLHKLPGTWQFWAEYDKLMIDRCDEVWILCIDGWENSVGVKAELNYAQSWNKKIHYVRKDSDYEYIIR